MIVLLLATIVVLLVAILCRLDSRVALIIKRTTRVFKFVFFTAIIIGALVGLRYLLGPDPLVSLGRIHQALKAGDGWTWCVVSVSVVVLTELSSNPKLPVPKNGASPELNVWIDPVAGIMGPRLAVAPDAKSE